MANERTLDELILEAIQEDISKDTWNKIMPKPIRSLAISKGTDTGLPDVLPTDVFDAIAPKDGTANSIKAEDVKYFLEHPKEITTDIQSKLIAISRIGYAGSDSEFDKHVPAAIAKVTKELSATGLHGNRANTLKIKLEKLNSIKDNKTELLAMAVQAELALAALEDEISKAAKEKQSVSAPRFRPVSSEAGGFPPEQLSVVNRVLDSASSFKGKLETISAISKIFYDADKAKIEDMKPSELLSNIQFLDIMNSFVKEFDSGSGAYLFEYFLALIAGGTVTGKSKTAGGKMGATDFTIGDKLGSAKYIQTMAQATQATNGFVDLYNKTNQPVEMFYVIALKKQDQEQRFDATDNTAATKRKQARGSSEPTRIVGLEIYMPTVKYDGKGYTVDGQPAKLDKKTKEIKIGANPGSPVGFIYLTKSRTSTFRQMLGTAIDTQENTVLAAFEQFKKYFQSLEDASSKAKIYINDGVQTDGNAVYDSLNNAESEFEAISGFLEYDNKPVKPVAENKNQKNSLKDLDKLIEHVILYNEKLLK